MEPVEYNEKGNLDEPTPLHPGPTTKSETWGRQRMERENKKVTTKTETQKETRSEKERRRKVENVRQKKLMEGWVSDNGQENNQPSRD